MATSLYRKHRPQAFGEITGQRHIITTLQRQLEMDRVGHAYLFAGPRGTGKTTTSRVLAKAVNCTSRKAGTAEPCNACAACTSITAGNALDVLEIDAASHTGVDHVREHIIGNTRVSPSSLRWKVFIIDEVHMLSLAAFNALLKTLEEPPANVLFVLATTEISKLPLTIVSRCQRFDFKKISAHDMVERLVKIIAAERRQVDDGVVSAIIANAEGSVRDAESLLEQVLALAEDPVTLDQARLVIPHVDAHAALEMIELLARKNTRAALEYVNRITNDGVDVAHFAEQVTEWLRRALLLKSGVTAADVAVGLTTTQEQQLASVAGRLTMAAVTSILSLWMARTSEVRQSSIPQLPLELAIVEICHPAGSAEPAVAAPPDAAGQVQHAVENRVAQPPTTPSVPAPAKPNKGGRKKSDAGAAEPLRPAAAPEPAAPVVGFDRVVQEWPAILAQVKTKNYSLFSLLRVMQPLEVSGNTLRLGTAYDFHLERIIEMKNRIILEQTITQVLGTVLRVEGVLTPSAASKPGYAAEDDALQPLLENFGGKIVE